MKPATTARECSSQFWTPGVDMTHEMFRDTPEEARLTRTALQNLLDTEELQCESLVSGVGASTLYHNGKIPFQFDYGDKDANGAPPASGGEHGTHVAATAAGNDGVNSMVMGVAPEAQVINMKVSRLPAAPPMTTFWRLWRTVCSWAWMQ